VYSWIEHLSTDEYWRTAFDPNEPFADGYVMTLRRGLLEGNPSALNLHREAICAVNSGAFGPLMLRTLELASDYPDADFVESLAFAFESEGRRADVLACLSELPVAERQAVVAIAKLVATKLRVANDDKLADSFEWLSAAASSQRPT
jgi:hypothetical protein